MNHTNYLNTRLHQKSSVRPLHSNRLVYLDILAIASNKFFKQQSFTLPFCPRSLLGPLHLFKYLLAWSLLQIDGLLASYQSCKLLQTSAGEDIIIFNTSSSKNSSSTCAGLSGCPWASSILQTTILQPVAGKLDVLWHLGTSSAFLAASPGVLDLHVIDSSNKDLEHHCTFI